MAESGLLIDMRRIVKTYNPDEPSEVKVCLLYTSDAADE